MDSNSFLDLPQLMSKMTQDGDNPANIIIGTRYGSDQVPLMVLMLRTWCNVLNRLEVSSAELKEFEQKWQVPILKIDNKWSGERNEVHEVAPLLNIIFQMSDPSGHSLTKLIHRLKTLTPCMFFELGEEIMIGRTHVEKPASTDDVMLHPDAGCFPESSRSTLPPTASLPRQMMSCFTQMLDVSGHWRGFLNAVWQIVDSPRSID
uniref:Uncharacterized protein n=1 Tax=Timema monikensis TaxID=170555 RepID=A0A7R9E927_9NEOP|nr:unnamed protein product [Timema monikensis]